VTATQLLQLWRSGRSRDAFDNLVALLYEELERVARSAMRGERRDHTLQTHALLHEAYGRLVDADVDWRDRAHFMAIAARTMRRILVDHGKSRRRAKRSGGVRVELTERLHASPGASSPVDVLVLNDAMERLAAQDERQAHIVELHFFGGLTCEETAEALGVSTATIERNLRLARAWLRRDLSTATA
jgi:RNA polymerase sigma factor (TIGR02999 family)